MARMSQKQMILEHLKSGDSITPADALREYGCMRLAAVIHLLREDHDINTHEEHAVNRFGRKISFARYRMALPKNNEVQA
jgi:hypothetical protein